MRQSATSHGLAAPFDGRSNEYLKWRDLRLTRAETKRKRAKPGNPSAFITASADALCHSTLTVMANHIRDHGYCLYRGPDSLTEESQLQGVIRLARQLGLITADRGVVTNKAALSILKNLPGSREHRFPPYNNLAMGWHTDGYYSDKTTTIQSFVLHCVFPATQGGTLSLLDPELVLIALYDREPEIVRHLSVADALTIPGNSDDSGHKRPDTSVPVFSVENARLMMRFTTRQKNIQFRNIDVKTALTSVSDIIDQLSDYRFDVLLQSGEGVITRNVLHRRTTFTDAPDQPPRTMIRGRYHEQPRV